MRTFTTKAIGWIAILTCWMGCAAETLSEREVQNFATTRSQVERAACVGTDSHSGTHVILEVSVRQPAQNQDILWFSISLKNAADEISLTKDASIRVYVDEEGPIALFPADHNTKYAQMGITTHCGQCAKITARSPDHGFEIEMFMPSHIEEHILARYAYWDTAKDEKGYHVVRAPDAQSLSPFGKADKGPQTPR